MIYTFCRFVSTPNISATLLCSLLFVMNIVLLSTCQAQLGSSEQYEPEELKNHFQNQAQGYKIVADGKSLELRRQPLMKWSNPIRSQEQGSLYVWTLQGRPLAFASIFSYQWDGKVFCRHEMQSLAETSLSASLHGRQVWSPRSPGLQRVTIDDVPAPSNSAARRLTRMRGIARQFTGTLNIPERQLATLTLKPQPVIRFESKAAGVIDGGVFSLAVATDPEIWLVIEAVKDKNGTAKWSYAPIRSHYHELELKRNGSVVWKAPMILPLENTRAAQTPFMYAPYFVFHADSAIPAPEELQ